MEMELSQIIVSRYSSPVGNLLLGAFAGNLCLCDWDTPLRRAVVDPRICRRFKARYAEGSCDVLERAVCELDEYFSGRRTEFTIPVEMAGTPFQQQVWQELLHIPYGVTVSYGSVAARIGHSSGVRAVASAIAANPVSLLVPCHRVIGADKKLTGYAGGMPAKEWLLALERCVVQKTRHTFGFSG